VPIETGRAFRPRKLETPLDRLTRHTAGKRSFTRTDRKRGRYVSSRPAKPHENDIAFDATMRQAAPHQRHRSHDAVALAITPDDVHTKIRVRRASNLILFVVDASWSMAAEQRMVATKGAILSLLMDAYQKRDQVALITFQREDAKIVLPPTSSVEQAKKVLRDIPIGGKTPLASGLLLAHRLVTNERRKNPELMPLVILLTDGAGNVSIMGNAPQKEALMISRHLRENSIRSVVINTEHESLDRGLAQGLADGLGAPCYTLHELGAQELYRTVRGELS
jgi:magnesium chelatase subunit D